MSSWKTPYVLTAGICSVLLGFAIDFLSYRLLAVPPDPMGNARGLSYQALLEAQAQSRAHASLHLGIGLMIFGFVIIALAVHAGLQGSSKQKV